MTLPYSYDPDPAYISRAPSAGSGYAPDDRRVSTSSSAGSHEHPYSSYNGYHHREPYPPRATSPMLPRPYEYPLDSSWSSRRPSAEQSPVSAGAPRPYEEQYHPDDSIPPLAQPQLAYIPLDHQSPMQSLGSSSSNSTGLPASPDLALPSGLVIPAGAIPPSAQNPGQRAWAFVSLAGSTIRKRPRRRYDEIERLYSCSFEDCTKAYGTLNHLNAHVTMQKHGPKRQPSEFKELRKLWRNQKKAELGHDRSRRRRGVGTDDSNPRALHRAASGSYSTDPESDEGTPQPSEYGPVEQIWPQEMVASGHVSRFDNGPLGYPPEHDPHAHPLSNQHTLSPSQSTPLERISPNATLLQPLAQSHPSQQPQHFSSPHSLNGYNGLPMPGNPSMNMRRPSDGNYEYHRPGPGPHGPYGR